MANANGGATDIAKTLTLVGGYGPYAFGVAMVMIMWTYMLKPELDSRKIDYEANLAIVTAQAELARNLDETSRTMSATAQTMQVTTTILERVVDKIEQKK